MAAPIVARLVLNTQAFSRGVGVASTGISKLSSGMAGLAGLAGKVAIAFTGVATAIGAVIIRQTALISQLADTSRKLGVNVQILQKFRYAAEQVGISTDTADMALQRFTRRVAEAAQGTGEARAALAGMGIQLRNSDGSLRSTEDILYDVADGLSEVESESEQLRIAFKLFDSEGVGLVSTLNQGSDALRGFFNTAEGLGAVLNRDAVDGVKRFDDALTDLRFLIGGVTNQFVAALAPALEDVTTKFIAFIQKIAQEQGGFENLGKFLKDEFIDGVIALLRGFESLTAVLASIVNAILRIVEILPDVKMPHLSEDAQDAADKLKILDNVFSKTMNNLSTTKLLDALEEAGANVDELRAKAAAAGKDLDPNWLTRELEQLGNMYDQATGSLDPLLVEIMEFRDAYIKELEATVEGGKKTFEGLDFSGIIDILLGSKEENQAKMAEIREQMNEETQAMAKDMGLTYEKVLDAIFGQERMTKFWNVFDDEASTSIDKLQAALQVVFGEEGIGRLRERLQPMFDVATTLEDGFVTAMQKFEDSLTTFIKTGKLSFSDLADHIKTVLIKAFVQKAIMGPLLSLFGLGAGGGAGGGISSLISGLFRADGGPVSANKPYIVGERGPELFMPKGSGDIVSNEDMMGMGGGGMTQVTYNINAVDAPSFRSLVARDPEFIYSVTQAGARRLPR